MPSIRCPHCAHEMALKGAKPGRFSPACPLCKVKFSLFVPAETDQEPVASPLERRAAALGASMYATAPRQASAPSPATVQTQGTVHPQATAQNPASRPIVTTSPALPIFRDLSGTLAPSRPSSADSVHGRIASVQTPAPWDAAAQPAPAPTRAPMSARAESVPAYSSPTTLEPMPELHGRLGGYEVKQKLGQGGMGAVYLARQISLDRDVALKVLAPSLAADPEFVSRFTREAYAAAQLTHHNVVQIHDIGVETSKGAETNYFSMEFVQGQTLGGVVKESGRVDADAAVGYILQAARGLKFAHDHGLIHRDVKPDNLLLNDQGVVKVADLGLVKRTGTSDKSRGGKTLPPGASSARPDAMAGATQMSVSMGTPAYMPPEQARDAAAVDARADIYSLGCTLYDLLTGRPPFVGNSAIEVMTKHAMETPAPPDRIAKHVPAALSLIVMKMIAKRPEERYQTMAEVIAALEDWLGVESGKPFSPKEEHIKVIESAAERFNDHRWAKLRRLLIRGFFGLSIAATVVLALPTVGRPLLAAGMVGFMLATLVMYQLIYGLARRTVLLRQVRRLVFGSRVVDWLSFLAAVTVGVLLLMAFNLQWVWLAFAGAAACVAVIFHFSIDMLLAKDREPLIAQAEKMLKEMRLRGLDEISLRQFVCKYSGRRWEEFYEALFGYEAKMLAREHWGRGERGRNRPKHAAWRDAIIAWIDHLMRSRQQARERQLMATLEAKAMAARGIDLNLAAKQARRKTDRLLEKAATVRQAALARSAQTALPMKSKPGPVTANHGDVATLAADWMHDDAPDAKGAGSTRKHEGYLSRRYGSPLDVIFGQAVRLLLGLALLAGFGQWWNLNGGSEARKQAAEVMTGAREDVMMTASRKDVSHAIQTYETLDVKFTDHVPLQIRFVPQWICDAVGGWNGGIAGALLVLSSICAGKRFGLSMLLAAALALFGAHLHVAGLQGHAWAAAGTAVALWAAGVMFLRRTRGT